MRGHGPGAPSHIVGSIHSNVDKFLYLTNKQSHKSSYLPSTFVAHGVGGLQQSRGELPSVVSGLVNDTLRSWVDRRGRSAKNRSGGFIQ